MYGDYSGNSNPQYTTFLDYLKAAGYEVPINATYPTPNNTPPPVQSSPQPTPPNPIANIANDYR